MSSFKTLKDWNKGQEAEILGPDNRWYSGEEVGHTPSKEECAQHYVKCGGANEFAKKHKRLWVSKQKEGGTPIEKP